MTQFLRYRLLTGPDDKAFCERVSAALDQGYKLHGSPAITFNGERCIVAQAIVLHYGATAGDDGRNDSDDGRNDSDDSE